MRIEPRLRQVSAGLLVAVLALVLIDTLGTLVDAGPRVLAAVALTLGAALAAGHWLGGPEPAMRTAVAISSAARNPGLALLVATVNHAPSEVTAVILAYLVVAVFGIVPYIAWRRRAERRPA
jgi:BASS family bile acid:Na+ symporter